MKSIHIPYLHSRPTGFRWYYLVAIVGILGIVGIIFWLYKTDNRLLNFVRGNHEQLEEAA